MRCCRGANVYTRPGVPLKRRDCRLPATAATLEKIGLDDVTSQGYCFQIDLMLRTIQQGLRVVEVPITFVERTRGESKMNGDIVVEAFRRVMLGNLPPHRPDTPPASAMMEPCSG